MTTPLKTGTWVVIVGINFYVEEVNRLKGAVNDANLFQEHLKCIPNLHLRMFTADVPSDGLRSRPAGNPETWPTYDNITEELRHILDQALPGDLVHFHFSGHGTRREKTEREYQDVDGKDAALVLFDDTTTTKARYFHGIELANILDKMVNKGLKVSLVLDCCHSGSVSRSAPGTRGIPWDDATSNQSPIDVSLQAQQASSRAGFRDGESDHHWLLIPEAYAMLTACGPHERAKEVRVKGRYHGALSMHVIDAIHHLKENETNRTYKNIIHRVRAKMYEHQDLQTQNPQLMGTDSMIFEAALSTTRKNQATCEVIGKDGLQVVLNIGYIHGVHEGDEYTLVGATASKGSLLIVTKVDGFSSTAKKGASQERGSPTGGVEIGLSAILTRATRPKAQVRVYHNADPQWEDKVKTSAWIEIVPSNDPLAVDVPCLSVIHNNEEKFEIINSHSGAGMNMPSIKSTDPDAMERTITLLEHLTKFLLTENLENKGIDVLAHDKFRIQFADSVPTSLGQNEVTVGDGETILIVVYNFTDDPLYCTILNLRPLRQIARIPKDREHKIVLAKDQCKTKIRMSVPKSLKERGETEVIDIFKFIITTRPIRMANLMLPDPESEHSRTRGAEESSLDDWLQGCVYYDVMRGSTQQWTCCNKYIRTVLQENDAVNRDSV